VKRLVQTTTRGWATVTEVDDDARKRLLTVPGVYDLGGPVKVPYTAWDLPQIVADLPELQDAQPKQAAVELWERARPLLPHQDRAVKTLLDMLATTSGAVLADEMGLGKTQTAITVARRLLMSDRPKRLIVGPKYVRAVWEQELLATGAITDPRQLTLLSGRDVFADKSESGFRRDATWYFLHYDILHDWIGRLHLLPFGVVIFDEAHIARSARTKRGDAANMIAGVIPFRLVLTGTPIVNTPSELWNLVTMATGPRTWGSEFDFRVRYCGAVHGGHGYIDVGPTEIDELRERLHHCYLRREVSVLGDVMPPISRQSVVVDIDDAARASHDCALTEQGYTAESLAGLFATGGFGSRVFELLGALQKITTRAKLATTAEHVRNLVVNGADVVVFVNERATARALANKIGSRPSAKDLLHVEGRPVYEVTGALGTDARAEVVGSFQGGGGVLVATYGSLGLGVTLTRARAAVLHDIPWTFAAALQAEKRVHRIGSKQAVTTHWMLANDSIDTIVARVLLTKAAVIDEALGIDSAARAAADTRLADIAGSADDVFQKSLNTWLEKVA